MNRFFLLVLVMGCFNAGAQSSDPWIRFERGTTGHFGFKDRRGAVRIAAGPMRYEADTFHNILAVVDSNGHSWYLLKNGSRIGIDSVHFFDATPDCESEGTIRFRDRRLDRVGFFDGNGRVVIPAVYNYASPFHNGLSVAYRNGRKECADRDTANCEHWTWAGGEQILINDRNEVIAQLPAETELNIDWYSIRKNQPPPDTATWVSIKGTHGDVYYFLHLERDFRHWLKHDFEPALRSDSAFQRVLFPTVSFSRQTNRVQLAAGQFRKRIGRATIAALFKADSRQQIETFRDSWFMLTSGDPIYRRFLTACGEHDQERFPGFEMVVSYYIPRRKAAPAGLEPGSFFKQYELGMQRSLQFLRTQGGYRLVGISF